MDIAITLSKRKVILEFCRLRTRLAHLSNLIGRTRHVCAAKPPSFENAASPPSGISAIMAAPPEKSPHVKSRPGTDNWPSRGKSGHSPQSGDRGIGCSAGANFRSNLTLANRISALPITEGGVASRLTKSGNGFFISRPHCSLPVKRSLAQHRVMLHGTSRKADDKPICLRASKDLAGQALAVICIEQLIKTQQFIINRRAQRRLSSLLDLDTTGCACASTVAFSLYRHTIIPQHLR